MGVPVNWEFFGCPHKNRPGIWVPYFWRVLLKMMALVVNRSAC